MRTRFLALAVAAASVATVAHAQTNLDWARDRYARAVDTYTSGQQSRGRAMMAEARAYALATVRAAPQDQQALYVLRLINDWEKQKGIAVAEQAEIDAFESGRAPAPAPAPRVSTATSGTAAAPMKTKIAAPPGWTPGRASQVPGLGPIAFVDVGPDSASVETFFTQNRAVNPPVDRIQRAHLFTQPQATRLYATQTLAILDAQGNKVTDLPAGEEVVAFQYLTGAGVRILTADGLEGLVPPEYLDVDRPANASLPVYPRQLQVGGRSQDLTQKIAANDPAYGRLQSQLASCVASSSGENCGVKFDPLLKKIEDEMRRKELERVVKQNRVARGYSRAL